MNNIDNLIENTIQKQIYEPEEFEQVIVTAFETKKHTIIHSNIIIKFISLISAFIAITASVVFAKDISKWINNIFKPETTSKGIIQMAEDGYIQNTNMDFIEDNGISVKVDNILMDDYNLDIVFEVKSKGNIEPIYNIEISDLIISDENNNLIYCSYDRIDLYEDFCKKHNIEFSNKNMHNNYTNEGYQTEVIERTDNSVKFLYKLYSTGYPKSKKLIFDFKNINIISRVENITNDRVSQNLEGEWNIEVDLPEVFYNRKNLIYSVKDKNDKKNNIILKEAIGTYTEMRIELTIKKYGKVYEPTEEGLDNFLKEILNIPENDIIATLENQNGKIFEKVISNKEGSNGRVYHPNGDVTCYFTFPITRDEYTNILKLNLTIKDKRITINLSK